jgi:hypothetical protein
MRCKKDAAESAFSEQFAEAIYFIDAALDDVGLDMLFPKAQGLLVAKLNANNSILASEAKHSF